MSFINGKISHDRWIGDKVLGYGVKIALRGEFGACRGMGVNRDSCLY